MCEEAIVSKIGLPGQTFALTDLGGGLGAGWRDILVHNMAERLPQTLDNHVRFDPVFHFFLVPLSAATFVAAAWRAVRSPDFGALWLALLALLFTVAVFVMRVYALKVQDRVIRLEERLRLTALAPESLRARIGDLTAGQLIALRFASDAELPALAAKSLDQKLAPRDIKKSVRTWRSDTFRV